MLQNKIHIIIIIRLRSFSTNHTTAALLLWLSVLANRVGEQLAKPMTAVNN